MSGLILPSSYETRSAIGRGEDVADITRSVQDGDMTIGWRGDPTMDVYREGSQIKVYGFDAAGGRYIAATVNLADSDWRSTLLRKLRDGDWQRDTFLDDQLAQRLAHEKAVQDEEDARTSEQADRLTTNLFKALGRKRHF